MERVTMRFTWVLLGLIAALTMSLAACSSDDPTATPTPRSASEPQEKPKLIFSDLNWSTALLQNAVARTILEKGYGYETDAVSGGTIPLMQALSAGDTNVTMEIWLPNQQAAWAEATEAGTVSEIGDSLASVAWQSAFLIPQYTADANPGLRAVEDIPDHMDLFVRPDSGGKAGLITCIPGWECERVNEKQVHGYGLDEVITLINPGSYEGLNAEILGAFEKEEDVLFYYWGPETLPAKLNTTYGGFHRLEEPAYSEECWDHMTAADEAEDVTQACEYSDAEVLIAVRSELRESAPDAVAFLEKWTLSDAGVNALLSRLDSTGDDYDDVAAWWLRTSDEWQAWVAPGVADDVIGALGGPIAKPKLIFSDLNWSTALLQNAVARTILEKGYGYETDAVSGGTIPLMQALSAGDTNVTMEIWLPNQQAAWAEATEAGTVSEIGDSLASVAWQSAFLIPQYTADANPGLRAVEDIPDHMDLFVRPDSGGKAGLITCIPGWECERVNEKQVHGYGLDEVITLINPGSYEGLNAEILGAFEKEEDVLFYYWGPETLPAKLNTTYGGFHRLEEPAYSEECWDHMTAADEAEDVTQACEYSDAEVLIAVRSELRESAPDAVAFLEKWTLSDAGVNALLSRLDSTGDDYGDVAAWWLRTSDEWQAWVAPGMADRVLAGI